ncbi:MAG TPA: serine/threonine-protein kinase [Gemmatimonadaceae bacterium]
MKHCPACRREYADDAKFCTRDGSRLLGGPFASTGHGVTPSGDPDRGPGDDRTGAQLIGALLDGRYRIERKVGEGGMSFVYRATDVESGQPCAIKVLSATLSRDANAMARLKREAGLGMRLSHPNVCPIVRMGETSGGQVYVVMPFIDGEILAQRNYRLGHQQLDTMTPLVRDVAAGLHAAHELKIIHRDLKPENIMISRRLGGAEYAVVMDFGLAKERRAGAELQRLTATGIIMGTPEFMSPEQLRGHPLDARTDLYSLALVICESLTGRLPFQGRTQQETMMARLRSDPMPLRRMNPDMKFPEAVDDVLIRALARNPDDRYRTVLEFADAFTQAAGLAEGAGNGRTGAEVGQ